MGTNYYLIRSECPTCKRHDKLHIGKSSAGWRFIWHGMPDSDPPIVTNKDWIAFLKASVAAGDVIRDEYERKYEVDAFVAMVFSSSDGRSHVSEFHDVRSYLDPDGQDFLSSNFS